MIQIAYEAQGKGSPLLLIQGLGYARWGWEPIVAPLARSFRVIAFDNRGIGQSEVTRGPYTARLLAEDALGVLDSLGVERAHVCGASLGGMVAQELAAGWPERVDRLVLCCTSPGLAKSAFPMPRETVRLFADAPSMRPEVALRRFVENSLVARGEVVDTIYERRLLDPPDPVGWAGQAAAGTGFAGVELGAIKAPTLVLHGTEDNVLDFRNAQLLADLIPDARAELLPGTGHLFWWEQPERVVELIRDFLSEGRPTPISRVRALLGSWRGGGEG
jgi:pimeloyl-ACP methyl ester carboxylesterase